MIVKFTDNSDAILKEFASKSKKAMEAIGLQAEGDVKDVVPVDTGNLRNSINHSSNDDTAVIGTNIEYAPYVELGTSKQRAKPYLKPSILNNMNSYKAIAKQIYNT